MGLEPRLEPRLLTYAINNLKVERTAPHR